MDVYALTNSDIMKWMGEKIRQYRLQKNISQKELAVNAGVSLSSVASIEQGRSVTISTFISLLRALDALQLLDAFMEESEISPIEYARLLDAKKQRKRASATSQRGHKSESEW